MAEYERWQRYFVVEPFGPIALSRAAGILAVMTASPHMKPGRKMDLGDLFPELAQTRMSPKTGLAKMWNALRRNAIDENASKDHRGISDRNDPQPKAPGR